MFSANNMAAGEDDKQAFLPLRIYLGKDECMTCISNFAQKLPVYG